jgi:hypothetical protein
MTSDLAMPPAPHPLAAEPKRMGSAAVEWVVSDSPVPYLDAVAAMEKRAAAIFSGDGCWSIRQSTRPAPAPTPQI